MIKVFINSPIITKCCLKLADSLMACFPQNMTMVCNMNAIAKIDRNNVRLITNEELSLQSEFLTDVGQLKWPPKEIIDHNLVRIQMTAVASLMDDGEDEYVTQQV